MRPLVVDGLLYDLLTTGDCYWMVTDTQNEFSIKRLDIEDEPWLNWLTR